METLIKKTVKGQTMEAIFDNCETFSVRHFKILGVESSGANYNPKHIYDYEINIRHANDKNASDLFDTEVIKHDGLPQKKYLCKTKNQLIQFFEDNGFNVHQYKQGKKTFGEVETWTSGGVNMILSIEPFNVKTFKEVVESFSVDEEIELHRQGEDYKKAFTLRQSLEDFEQFETKLKNMVQQLN